MNKILGILLFVIMVVGSASIAFAYDPGVTTDGNSEDTNSNPVNNNDFLAAGTDDDKQAQYQDVVAKKGVYDSIKIDDYENNTAYFDALSSAWANYVDALALYDNTTNATDLKDKLSNSINAYLKTSEDLELIYINSNGEKVIWDDQVGAFIYNATYFDDLRTSWRNYLDTLFGYDGVNDVNLWFNQLNESIIISQNNFNEILGHYNTLVYMKDTYLDKLSEVIANLSPDVLTDDNFFDDLCTAWENYIDALFIFDNTTTPEESVLKAKINDIIDVYLADALEFKLSTDVSEAHAIFQPLFDQFIDDLNNGVVVSAASVNVLLAAWDDYYAACVAWDDEYGPDLLLGLPDVSSIIDDLEKINNINIAKVSYNAERERILGIVDSSPIPLSNNDFDTLRTLWATYAVAWEHYDSSISSDDMIEDLESWIGKYIVIADEINKRILENLGNIDVSRGTRVTLGSGNNHIPDPQYNPNDGLKLMHFEGEGGDYFEISLGILSPNEPWEIVVTGNIPLSMLTFDLYYFASGTAYKNQFTVTFYGNGIGKFVVDPLLNNFNHIHFGNVNYIHLPKFEAPIAEGPTFEGAEFPVRNVNPVEFEGVEFPVRNVEPNFEGVEFPVRNVEPVEFEGVKFPVRNVDSPSFGDLPPFDTPVPTFELNLIYPQFAPPVAVEPEPPVTQPPEYPEDPDVSNEDPIDPPTTPEDPEDPKEPTVVPPEDPDDLDEPIILAHAGMKNTGLPIGLIITLIMSILIAIRIKK